MAAKGPKGLNPWKIQGYKPGQNVICKIMKAEPGGYAVIIPKDNLPGYLPTQQRHNVGEELLVTYICIDKNRMLLAERYGKSDPAAAKTQSRVNWQEHLSELEDGSAAHQAVSGQADPYAQYMPQADGQYAQQDQYATGPLPSQQYATGPLPAQQPYQPPYDQQQQQQQQQQYQSGPQQQYQTGAQQQQYQTGAQQQQYQTGQQQPYDQQQQPQTGQFAQLGQQYLGQQQQQQQNQQQQYVAPQPGERYAEGVPTTRFRLQRAIDLIMPPIEKDTLNSLRIGDYDVEWLITDLEGGMRTGCVKAACESRLSRAAMLLYKGRAVGCIYGCKSDPTTKPTEESLQMMLADLESPDTMVTLYDLPENITLAMSSLFLGYPVERNDDYNAKEYLDYICNWLGQKSGTATLAISLTQNRGTCLGYIYKGEFSGAFYVEDQTFRADRQFIDELLFNDPQAGLEVSILPPEMHASAVRFGFSLSMARTRKME